MPRAASRLKTNINQKKSAPTSRSPSRRSRSKRGQNTFWIKIKQLILSYLQYLPTLILGLVFTGGVYLVLTYVDPDKIKHFILPNTYLPLLILFFLAALFIFSFVWLNSRRGLITALGLSLILFFKLQQFILTPTIIALIIAPLLMIELIFSLLSKLKT